MFTVRGTKKFLDRVGRPDPDPPASSTVLGDWYAKVLYWRPQVALFVNATTFVPVLMPFAPGLDREGVVGVAESFADDLHGDAFADEQAAVGVAACAASVLIEQIR